MIRKAVSIGLGALPVRIKYGLLSRIKYIRVPPADHRKNLGHIAAAKQISVTDLANLSPADIHDAIKFQDAVLLRKSLNTVLHRDRSDWILETKDIALPGLKKLGLRHKPLTRVSKDTLLDY